MGYSGQTGPMPVLTSLPEDWWDPAWQAAQSPGVTVPERGLWQAPAAGTAEPATPGDESPPSWRRVAGTTFSLWTSRHLPWLRRSSRRLVAVAALGAGLVAVGVGATGLTVSTLSSAHAAPLPARPDPIPAPTERTVLPASPATGEQAARPVWLSIPSIGVRTRLIHLGVNKNGTLQVPASTAVAGWYTGSPRPGTVGSAIIAGHVDSRSGPGIFFWLRTLRPGDRVYVGRADGTMAVFTVTRIKKFAKDRFPTAAVYGPVPDAELRLITCGGNFDRSLGSYLSNVVVFARLAG
ncbi:MAG TPA: class F sortase [Streptosporangiaceae bacterium]|nr:class F sortase [Streptosporangiaceae bacterium]